MADTIKPDYAMDLSTGKTIRTNPLKETDIEPWVKSDHDRAQLLLATYFHEEPFDNTEMRNLLKEHIGQDWVSIDSAISKYQQAIVKGQERAQLQTKQPLDTQIEAWKKMPKEQALKELTDLSKSMMEPAEKRIELEIIRTKADLMGALQPTISKTMQVVSIEINMPGQHKTQCDVIDVTATNK